ncbi:hypothetical protein P9J78_02155 [Glaesserella parasuis]|uniref:hypothetical protein n=1 Tax=Glaesserella parasuis TaxID=738 RepID=UPI002436907C|nr:hypothetical protein [Glaesserella parasuis]MDG6236824.1 hypothetical protein [Glaesserella parasuis]MDO9949459.1 hypothetical protein [Glaesserella parasuis]
MDVILAIIGIAFLWSVFQLISTRKASIELQNIIQTGISSPRYFFNNLSEPIFSELQYLEVNELKKIILGRMVELALIKGTSMSSINKALTHNIVRRICEDGAEEIAKKNY